MTGRPTIAAGVPVMPNAGRIRGEVIAARPEADGWGSVWDVSVHDVKDVPGVANFAAKHRGGIISLFVHPGLIKRAAPHDIITAKVAYCGDERGGRFIVLDDDLQKE